MTSQNMQAGERFVATCHKVFAAHGLTLRVGYDFEEYREILSEARPDHTIGAPFNPELHDFTDHQALWIVAENDQGQTVHTQALRVLNLSRHSLGQYLSANFTDFPPPDIPLDLDRSNYRAGPGAQRMTGRVAYHGEFWLGGATGEFRGSGVSTVLARYGFWMAMQTWEPDFIFAFILNAVHHKGLAARTGWMHTDPSALQWFPQGGVTPIETVMAYLHNADVQFLLELPMGEDILRPMKIQAA